VKFLRRLTLSKPLKIQIVELARALIADERHWCWHTIALDNNGVALSAMSPRAVRWCALGAAIAAAYQLTHDVDTAHKLAHEVLAPIGGPITLTRVNDTRGHSAVLALFDQVIAEGNGAGSSYTRLPLRQLTVTQRISSS
jgi:hypothetical protein